MVFITVLVNYRLTSNDEINVPLNRFQLPSFVFLRLKNEELQIANTSTYIE